ncbi:riboflavin biosynthesis protein RibF [Virgibacillus sp. DJP39]|uniref:riboflavin biosynthesis protein RibF n=1 Tax=Virgibacillus sp. DJP39 TaxID=3409790 RepID=UPI003BB6EB52
MEIIDLTGKQPLNKDPLILVIGQFDGVHKGHQSVLQTAKNHMDTSLDTLAVMFFSNYSANKITTDKVKLALLEKYGVGRYYRVKREEFVLEYLSQLPIKRIIIGEGFRFGSDGSSNTEELLRLCAQLDIEVTVAPLIKENGTKISSNAIRESLKEGHMERVHSLLGRAFTVEGTVIHGEKMGRKLGFPTINLGGTAEYVNPRSGVYLGVVGIYNKSVITDYYHVLISAGYRPTVKGKGYLIEAYLMNYSGDLYGKSVSLSFMRFIREEINYSNLDDLVKQMELDKKEAERLMG